MSQQIPCPSCNNPTGDGLLCRDCSNKLRKQLGQIPGLMRELTTTITRQSVSGEAGYTAERPLPFDWDASDARWVVHNTLTTWVRELDLGDTQGLANNPRALTNWLTERIQRIRIHGAADEIADQVDYCVKLLRAEIDIPGDSVLCGNCPVCGVTLYASPIASEVVCRRCEIVGTEVRINVAGQRRGLFDRAKDELVNRKQILTASTFYGVSINPSTLRTWIHRGELEVRETRNGTPLYRLGDAIRLASRINLVKAGVADVA